MTEPSKLATTPIHIATLISAATVARDNVSGMLGTTIIVQLIDGTTVPLFMTIPVANALAHTLEFGHLPTSENIDRCRAVVKPGNHEHKHHFRAWCDTCNTIAADCPTYGTSDNSHSMSQKCACGESVQ